jgi:putative sigma-54 modulation protein
MIANVAITGVGTYTPDDSTKKYIRKKVGSLDRLVPRHARKSMHAEVKLAEINQSHGNKYEVEIVLHVPDKVLTAKDTTMNVLAAADIVEAKIANQLRKYKQDIIPHVGRRKLLDRFKRSYARG